MNEENHYALEPRPSLEIETVGSRAQRLLPGMLADTLILAREFIATQLELDELSHEWNRRNWRDKGERMSKENIQAFDLFHRAAVAGHGEAQFMLFRCYRAGNGVAEDHTKAIEWLKKAADVGFVNALYRLGTLYWTGKLIEKDIDKALEWLKRAIEAYEKKGGAPAAICHLISLIYEERSDSTEAFRWTIRAAEFGCYDGLCTVARAYKTGKVKPANIPQAHSFFRIMVESGNKGFTQDVADYAGKMSDTELRTSDEIYRRLKNIPN